ncbi:hypothetical protein [Natronoflexus pectinivorans]|uniref:Uncharacterized protein n=1 Tax=Natronoflexus pectinivorans TaxID=682526 RepID=A0A4R2G956_9BACT|nr:hypothetical protein [Natronoflexus pectinivorans]TCO04425.1 hypothetical protein EV194_11814 [Natronoflexus pectinivorans]
MLLKNILFITCFGLLVSFNMKYNLETDKILVETFNDEELNDIIKLIDYVDKLVKAETKSDDVKTAYPLYFEKLKINMFEGNYIVPINRETKCSIFERINENTFDEFWYLQCANMNKISSMETSRTELSININGKYVDYIRKIGEADPLFQDLYEFIMSTGHILSASMMIFLASNEGVDFNLIKNRLLAVVCIFSISEPIEKRED